MEIFLARVLRDRETTRLRLLKVCSGQVLRVRVITPTRAAKACKRVLRRRAEFRDPQLHVQAHLVPVLVQASAQAAQVAQAARVPVLPVAHVPAQEEGQEAVDSAQAALPVVLQAQALARTGQPVVAAVVVDPVVELLVRLVAAVAVQSPASPSARSAQSLN